MVPQEWIGKRVEIDLVRPGPTLMGTTYQGTLNAVTDLGIVATLRTRGLDLRTRVGHIPIEARFDLHFYLKVRDPLLLKG